MAQSFESKAIDHYGEVCVDKSMVRQSGLGARSIPAYVSEWIVSRNITDGTLVDAARTRMRQFVAEHLPAKDQKEQLKQRLMQGDVLRILDEYSVVVNLRTNQHVLRIPCLDDAEAEIAPHIVDAYPLLLGSGVWGVGRLEYVPPEESTFGGGHIRMVDFRPMQAGRIDMDLFCERRQHFTLDEWRDLLVSSMGYNPDAYSPSQQMLLITRLIPIAQERVNLVELAPKGTGKSFVFLNLSRYVRLISGGKVTPAVLFHNNANNQSGLLVFFDVVVFDEAQTLSFENPNEVVGVLKDYLESGRFSRGGKQQSSATAGIVILGNIPLDADNRPRNLNLFQNLPQVLRETALIDRIHGILPGWELPRIQASSISNSIGFKADFLGEILHSLRHRPGYEGFVKANSQLDGTTDVRDLNAIERLASGYLKLLYPNMQVGRQEYIDNCLRPAVALRQRVREQLVQLDPEFKRVRIEVA